jgi:hypothetical protein
VGITGADIEFALRELDLVEDANELHAELQGTSLSFCCSVCLVICSPLPAASRDARKAVLERKKQDAAAVAAEAAGDDAEEDDTGDWGGGEQEDA